MEAAPREQFDSPSDPIIRTRMPQAGAVLLDTFASAAFDILRSLAPPAPAILAFHANFEATEYEL